MKISAKGFVQIRSGKNCIADIKKSCHLGPFIFSVIFCCSNVYCVYRCFYCIIFCFHCTVVMAKD